MDGLVPSGQDDIEDLVLAEATEYVEGRRQADADLEAGRTRSLDCVQRDLDHEDLLTAEDG